MASAKDAEVHQGFKNVLDRKLATGEEENGA
jgi:hypothetical protein